MLRTLLPAALLALAAAPATAQVGSAGQGQPPAQTAPTPSKPPGGVYSAAPGKGWLDPAWVASLRARHEKAKATGQLSPARMARQAQRLVQLEAQLAAQWDVEPPAPKVGVSSSGGGG